MGGSISYDPKPPGDRRFVSRWTRDIKRLGAQDGDLVEFYRSREYSHWGLYLGNDKIAHFHAKTENRNDSDGEIDIFSEESAYNRLRDNVFVPGIVTIDKLQDIATVPGSSDKINKVRINNKPSLREIPRKIDEIRAIVGKLVDMNGLKYCSNLFNCEHFVTYIKFNRCFTELRWNNNSNGTIYETREVKRLYREVFLAQATGKPITVYDAQCYWIVHFMEKSKQQWEENIKAADNRISPKLLISELHMEIEDFMSALEKTDLYS